MDDRVYLELSLSKSVETDANGNYIIRAEASNENLDFQEQVVLQRALMDSKDYFLKNGVISWDHLHKRKDKNGNAISDPEYILGEPLGVEKIGGKTFVKAMLYKGNRIVEDIVSKLRKGSKIIKTSVGGMRPVIEKSFDANLGKMVERVVSVLWDELALTHKPVNQTLSPVQFVKSMQAGYSTDPATATGGAALIKQDLDGTKGSKKRAIKAVIIALTTGECTDEQSARTIIRDNGVIDDKIASDIIESVMNGKTQIKGVFKMDESLSKSFEDSITELEKAMKGGVPMAPVPKATVPPAPEDDELYEKKGEEGEDEHAEPDADNQGGPSDGDADNEDGNDPENGLMMPPAAPPVKKSQEADDVEFLDVSPVLESMSKSISAVTKENKALRAEFAEMRGLLKSMASNQIQSSQVLKSLADQPAMRKSVVNRQARNFAGSSAENAAVEMSREEILNKSIIAVRLGKMDMRTASILEDRVNKGMPVDPATVEFLKSIQ